MQGLGGSTTAGLVGLVGLGGMKSPGGLLTPRMGLLDATKKITGRRITKAWTDGGYADSFNPTYFAGQHGTPDGDFENSNWRFRKRATGFGAAQEAIYTIGSYSTITPTPGTKRYFELQNIAGGAGLAIGYSDINRPVALNGTNNIWYLSSGSAGGALGSGSAPAWSAAGSVVGWALDVTNNAAWLRAPDGSFWGPSGQTVVGDLGNKYGVGTAQYLLGSVTNPSECVEINLGQWDFVLGLPPGYAFWG